jgi:hypothetical protein
MSVPVSVSGPDIESVIARVLQDDWCPHVEQDPPCRGCQQAAAHVAVVLRAHIVTAQADAWDQGYTSGHSNAMRRMSDEPNAPTTPNPYRAALVGQIGADHD